MLLCSPAHASPRVALSGVPVCTGAHSRGEGVRVPAVFCPPDGLDLPRLGPSAPPGVGPHSSACAAQAVWGRGCAALPPPLPIGVRSLTRRPPSTRAGVLVAAPGHSVGTRECP